MAIHTYNKSEERGQFSAHVQDVNGNIIWEVNYPEFYEDDSTGELIESTTIFDDGFMKNTDDIEGLESYLKSMGTLKSEDELVSDSMANGGYMDKQPVTGDVDSITDKLLAQKIKIFLNKVSPFKYYYIDNNTLYVAFDENYTNGAAEKFYKEATSSREFFDADSVSMEYKHDNNNVIFSIKLKKEVVYARGGSVEQGNIDMIKNQVVQVEHHANELKQTLKSNPQVDAWVVAKMDRATSNLSDITHYLEGEQNSFADGGYMADGGVGRIVMIPTYVVKEIKHSVEMGYDTLVEGMIGRVRKGVMLINENYEVRGTYDIGLKDAIQDLIKKIKLGNFKVDAIDNYADGGYMADGGEFTRKEIDKQAEINARTAKIWDEKYRGSDQEVPYFFNDKWNECKLQAIKELKKENKLADGGYMDNGGAMPYGENKSYYKEGDIFTIENTRNAIIITKIDSSIGGYKDKELITYVHTMPLGSKNVFELEMYELPKFDRYVREGRFVPNKPKMPYGGYMENGGENDYEDEKKSYGHRYEDYDDNFQAKMREKYMRKMMNPSSYQIADYRHSDFKNKDADDVKRINRKLARGGKTDDYETYHNTLSAALSEAERFVKGRGYEFSEESYFPDLTIGGVGYGQTISTKRDVVEIGGKNRKNTLILVVYRMDSGKYELTMYFAKSNYSNGGTTYKNLSKIPPTYVNEPKSKSKDEGLVTKVKEVELVRKGVVEFKGVNQITSSQDSEKIFRQFWDENALNISEHFNVLLLNRANKPIGIYQHSKGSIDGTTADIIMICLAAVKSLAKGVIVAHNHPSGNLKPSEADKRLTSQLKNALSFFTITLVDSLIITPNDGYYSFTDEGMMEKGGQTSKMLDGGAIEKSVKEKLKANFELPFEVVVYIPSTEKATQVIGKRDFNERADTAEVFMSNLFGGFSATSVDGGYVGNKGNLIQEDAIKVTSFCQIENFTDNFKDFLRQVKLWAGEWTQEAIGIEFEGDMFYINSFKQDAISSLFPNDDSNVRKTKYNKLPKSEKDAALSEAKKVFEATSFS